MADNVLIAGAGSATAATDQIPVTLEHYQLIKLADPTADSTARWVKALATGADGMNALPVWANAIQLLTYDVAMRVIATGALTANTAKAILSFEHAAGSTKTMRLRRLIAAGRQTTLLAGALDFQITRGTAASTGGTGITPGPRKPGDAAADTVVKSLPTITAATVLSTIPGVYNAAAAANVLNNTVLYDWQEGGETKPYILRAGNLDSLVVNAISDVAMNWTLTMLAIFTEE